MMGVLATIKATLIFQTQRKSWWTSRSFSFACPFSLHFLDAVTSPNRSRVSCELPGDRVSGSTKAMNTWLDDRSRCDTTRGVVRDRRTDADGQIS